MNALVILPALSAFAVLARESVRQSLAARRGCFASVDMSKVHLSQARYWGKAYQAALAEYRDWFNIAKGPAL